MSTEFVWLQHEEHQGKAQFPAGAADVWQARGWHPCEAPPDVDPTRALVDNEQPIPGFVEVQVDGDWVDITSDLLTHDFGSTGSADADPETTTGEVTDG